MGSTAARRGPDPFGSEPMAYDPTHATSGPRPTKGCGAPSTKGTGQGGAMEPQELVAVGSTPGVLLGRGRLVSGDRGRGSTGLDGGPVVLEPGDGPLAVVNL